MTSWSEEEDELGVEGGSRENNKDKTIRAKNSRSNQFVATSSSDNVKRSTASSSKLDLNSYKEEEDSDASGFESNNSNNKNKLRTNGRGRLRVASESWDEDFEFQSTSFFPIQQTTEFNPKLSRQLSTSTNSSSNHSSPTKNSKILSTSPPSSPTKKKTWLNSPSRPSIPNLSLSARALNSTSKDSLHQSSFENDEGQNTGSSTIGLSLTGSKSIRNEDDGLLEAETDWNSTATAGGFALKRLSYDSKGKEKELKRENSRKEKERKGKMLPPTTIPTTSTTKRWRMSPSTSFSSSTTSLNSSIFNPSSTSLGRRTGEREILRSEQREVGEFVVLGRRSRATSPEPLNSTSNDSSPSKNTIRGLQSSSQRSQFPPIQPRSISNSSTSSSASSYLPTPFSSTNFNYSRRTEGNDTTTTEGDETTEGEFSDLDDPINLTKLNRRNRNLGSDLNSTITPATSVSGSIFSQRTISGNERWKGSQVSFLDHELDSDREIRQSQDSIRDFGIELDEDLGTVKRASSRKLKKKRREGYKGGGETESSAIESEGMIDDYHRGRKSFDKFSIPFAQDSADESRSRRRSFGLDWGNRSRRDDSNSRKESTDDLIKSIPFPPSPTTLPSSTSSSNISGNTTVRRRSLLKKPDSIVVDENAGKKSKRLSFTGLMSRSTSALPLPSPTYLPPLIDQQNLPLSSLPNRPTLSTRSASNSNSNSNPNSKINSSTTNLSNKLPRSESFITKARVFSRTKTAPLPSKENGNSDHFSSTSPPIAPLSNKKLKPKPPPIALSHDSTFNSQPSKRNSSAPNNRSKKTHKPSFSLSSLGLNFFSSSNSTSTLAYDSRPPQAESSTRPRTALAVDRPVSYYFEDGFRVMDGERMRRNSLSDLRIPSNITSAQERIEEDLERVKEFAKMIEDLKVLQKQYQTLIQLNSSPPASPLLSATTSTTSTSIESPQFSGPPLEAVLRMAQAIKRLELDYQPWWEEAEALVNLGDGKSSSLNNLGKKESPGAVNSRRDRCTALVPQDSFTVNGIVGEAVSEFKDSASTSKKDEIEQEAITFKSLTLPSIKPSPPRPPLSTLLQSPVMVELPPASSSPISPSLLTAKVGIRKVSKVGVTGIKDFLFRLKVKSPTEDTFEISPNSIPPTTSLNRNQYLSPSNKNYQQSTLNRRTVSDPTKQYSSRPSTPPLSVPPPQLNNKSSKYLDQSTTPNSRNGKTPTAPSRISNSLNSKNNQTPVEGSSSSEEDWDTPPRNTSLAVIVNDSSPTGGVRGNTMKRSLTFNEIGSAETRGGEMGLNELVKKVKEVHFHLEECIHRLKGITI